MNLLRKGFNTLVEERIQVASAEENTENEDLSFDEHISKKENTGKNKAIRNLLV